MKTYAEQLDSVQQAIADIEAGQLASYELANRTVTLLNIDVLYRRETWLRAMVEREANGGGILVQGIEPVL